MKSLLKEIRDNNILLEIQNGKLGVFVEGPDPDPVLIEKIRENKDRLLDFLQKNDQTGLFTGVIPLVPEQPAGYGYELSSSQRMLWVLSQVKETSIAYNIPATYIISGSLDLMALESAFNRVISRHEILRTVFKDNGNGRTQQFILDAEHAGFTMTHYDLRTAQHQEMKLRSLLGDAQHNCFDLEKGPLLSAGLYRIEDSKWIFSCVMHHIIADEWSVEILIKELLTFYKTPHANDVSGELRIQYKDYSGWQRNQELTGSLEIHREYWLNRFKGGPSVLDISTDRPRPRVRNFRGATETRLLGDDAGRLLRDLCRRQGSTLFMGLFTILDILLYKYTGQNDITIGTPVAGRDHADLEDQIGFYTNTIALRTTLDGKDDFNETLQRVKASFLEGYDHRSYPFGQLVDQLDIAVDPGRNPLFDIMLVLKEQDVDAAVDQLSGKGLKIDPLPGAETGVSKFDLLFNFVELKEGLEASIQYSTDLFDKDSIERMLSHFGQLLRSVIETPEKPIYALDCLGDAEREKLQTTFMGRRTTDPGDRTILTLFEEQTHRAPENIAVSCGAIDITYRVLDQMSNQLAHYIRSEHIVHPNDLIGISMTASEQYLIAVLGVLKAGAACLPLDPGLPASRLTARQKDSRFLFTIDASWFAAFRTVQGTIATTAVPGGAGAGDCMYQIDTSAVAESSKTIKMRHAAMVNLVASQKEAFPNSKTRNQLQFADITSGLSFLEICLALSRGWTLYPVPLEGKTDPTALADFIAEKNISLLMLPADFFRRCAQQEYFLSKIRRTVSDIVVTDGQLTLSDRLIRLLNDSGLRLHNLYGPEVTQIVSAMTIGWEDPGTIKNSPSIGRPVDNCRIRILDEYGMLKPLGAIGEICIGGVCIANEYVDKEDLTGQGFMLDPFNKNQLLYKTGDLGKWLPDGTIEYKGRIDRQVTIRGYRIGLGDVQAAVLSHPDIDDSVVLTKKDEEDALNLVCYFVAGTALSPETLRTWLRDRLPGYMIPSWCIRMDQIPRTPDGKADKHYLTRLPDGPEKEGWQTGPRTKTEERLIGIWTDILGKTGIGRKDHFYDLGGHSLKGVRLASRIHKEFGIRVELKELLGAGLLETQAALIDDRKDTGFAAIGLTRQQPYYALSPAQKRLWVLSRTLEGNTAYNIPGIYLLEGDIDIQSFNQAFQMLIARHESLRTVFKEVGDEVKQWILSADQMEFGIRFADWRHLADQEGDIRNAIETELRTPLDLAGGPLLKAFLYRTGDRSWVFAYVTHHIISDAWSMMILIRDLLTCYLGLVNGETPALPELRIQFKDYLAWQRSLMTDEWRSAHRAFWLKHFEGPLTMLELPLDKPRPSVQTFRGASETRRIDAQMTGGIKRIARENDATLFMALLATVNVLLFKYTGQSDIILGTALAGREHIELEDQIGLYMHTLGIRTKFNPDDSFNNILVAVRQSVMGMFQHQDYPLDELIDALRLPRDFSRNPLFDVTVVLQNVERDTWKARTGKDGISMQSFPGGGDIISKFDLSFDFVEDGDLLVLTLVYNADLLFPSTAERIASHFVRLLGIIADSASVGIRDLDILDRKEKKSLLEDFAGATPKDIPDTSIIRLFQQQAAIYPGKIAVMDGPSIITYKLLDDRSTLLAAHLLEKYKVKPGDLLAIMLDRSVNLVIAILAILKSGAAYVPIDPEYPQQRKKDMLEDANIKVLITEADYFLDLGFYQGGIFAIDLQLDGLRNDTSVALPATDSSSLAYVIYTSGSTGRPKGVMIGNRSLLNLCLWHNERFSVTEKDNAALYAGISFDASVWELFPYLISGACLHIIPRESRLNVPELSAWFEKWAITISFLPTQIAEQFLQTDCGSLRYLLTGGDKLNAFAGQSYKLINNYGPTENTVVTTSCELKDHAANIPIGKPIRNTRVYILDEDLRLCPFGVIGEICVAGDGLALGYLNSPSLTAGRFAPDPFSEGQRMYRTGDLGRWLPDGSIEFAGRKDQQVKIRGYRIELGEIENALQTFPGIRSAAVLARSASSGDKELIGYLTCEDTLDLPALRAFLTGRLPSYMVPAHFFTTEELPLTTNGKIDRNRLADWAASQPVIVRDHILPRTPAEEKLVGIWQEVLGIDQISPNDDFFELGGHSLSVTRLISHIYKEFEVKLEMKTLFQTTLLEDQARLIENECRTIFTDIVPVPDQDHYILSSSQRRLWLLSQMEESNLAYNIPDAFILEGQVNHTALESAFRTLIARHEVLRTVFREDDQGMVRQFILSEKESPFRIPRHDLRGFKDQPAELKSLLEKQVGMTFDLMSGPLMKAALIQLSASRFVLSFVMHHIIGDGWSVGVLIKELMHCYEAFVRGIDPAMKPLRIQYRDYATWQQGRLDSPAMTAHKDYWLRQFEGELPVLELAGDKMRPADRSYNGGSVDRTINPDITRECKTFCAEKNGTLFMGLMSVVNVLLYIYTGQEDIIVGSPVAGREHIDLDDQIGFYVNSLALRTRFSGHGNFEDLFETVRNSTLAAFEHQEYPFDELVKELDVQWPIGRNPLFDVMVILQNNRMHTDEMSRFSTFELSHYDEELSRISKFDLLFNFVESAQGIKMRIEYNGDLFNHDTILRLGAHFEQLLLALLTDPISPIRDISCLTEMEKQQLLTGFNDTTRDYPVETTLIGLFEQQVDRSPQETAIVFHDRGFTYEESNRWANRLGHHLRKDFAVKPDDRIAIILKRDEWAVIAILGVLKSGGACLLIDAGYPEDRVRFLIWDSGCRVVIDEDWMSQFREIATDYPIGNPVQVSRPLDLAYLIYTSGSTGSPKGCMLLNKGIVNHLFSKIELLKLTAGNVICHNSELYFVGGIWQLWAPLVTGGKMILCDAEELRDMNRLVEKARLTGSKVLEVIPSQFNQYLSNEISTGLGDLQTLILTGEKINPHYVEKCYAGYEHLEIVNTYGQTESSDVTTSWKIPRTGAYEKILTGTPIGNTRIYVLTPANTVCPIGVFGEICASGYGTSRGYMNRPALTAEKFVANPFRHGERMYRTGDIGRWLPDGNLEVAGRKDHQIKIRGYRIELGEVEKALLEYEKIREVATVVEDNGDGENKLVAYIVANEQMNVSMIQGHLRKMLPDHMLPAQYVQLDTIPFLQNGKLDRKALAAFSNGPMQTGSDFELPANPTEERLVEICGAILGRKTIGVLDNLFQLGGNSLKMISLINRIRQEFDVRIPLKKIFRSPDIRSLAEEIENDRLVKIQDASEPVNLGGRETIRI